ncbi:hypothetical protein [Acanthopleuribacter pedis]|uniref:Uncharacterized protein n=1 Tax=Acanthopleuribacter pedis TaxID=442870 RepID=A0A8J7QNY6_9BACT|nr:hypothetical protein [Acanthopleuribacter pedis]MBO1321460.1 hypothetical protein [Acanthopleuribacter pedis]
MSFEEQLIFDYNEVPASPKIEAGDQLIGLTAANIRYSDGLAVFDIHVSAMVPGSIGDRYHNLLEAITLFVCDPGAGRVFSCRTFNDFVRLPREEEGKPNLISEPPFPPPTMKPPIKGGFRGGWVNSTLSCRTPYPNQSPSLFVHASLENAVSNAVGIDLLGLQAVVY